MLHLAKGRYPLHITFSMLFITLLPGTVLGLYDPMKTPDILLLTAKQIFDQRV